jgi:hypothetical protein
MSSAVRERLTGDLQTITTPLPLIRGQWHRDSTVIRRTQLDSTASDDSPFRDMAERAQSGSKR